MHIATRNHNVETESNTTYKHTTTKNHFPSPFPHNNDELHSNFYRNIRKMSQDKCETSSSCAGTFFFLSFLTEKNNLMFYITNYDINKRYFILKRNVKRRMTVFMCVVWLFSICQLNERKKEKRANVMVTYLLIERFNT